MERNNSTVRESDSMLCSLKCKSKGEKNARESQKDQKKRNAELVVRPLLIDGLSSSLILTARGSRRGAGIASYSRGIQFRPWNGLLPPRFHGELPCGRFRGRRLATALSDKIYYCTGVASILSFFFSHFNIQIQMSVRVSPAEARDVFPDAVT